MEKVQASQLVSVNPTRDSNEIIKPVAQKASSEKPVVDTDTAKSLASQQALIMILTHNGAQLTSLGAEKRSSNPEARLLGGIDKEAVEKLGVRDNHEAVDTLIALLDHKDEEIRVAAASSLCKIRDPRAIDPLIQGYKDSKISAQALVPMMAFIGDERADSICRELLNQDLNPYSKHYIREQFKNVAELKKIERALAKQASGKQSCCAIL